MLGIIFLAVGICVILNKKNLSMALEEITHNKGLLWVWGFICIALGAVLIAFNNGVPGSRLSLLVIVLGWLSVLKGACILVLPSSAVASFYKQFNKSWILIAGGIIAVVVGLFLLFGLSHSHYSPQMYGGGQQGMFNQQGQSNLPAGQ
jgi:hypothetical protein